MHPFEYANPSTTQEAVGLLGSRWGEVDVLAGGTDLISLMKEHLATPKRLVNIKNIKELGGIQDSKAGLRIGATVTLDELLESADVRKSFPSLTQAAQGVSSPQIRNMGTVGGDLCQRPRCWYYRGGFGLFGNKDGSSLITNGEKKYHAILGNSGPAYFVSASSLGPALIALGAKIKLVSAKGTRELAADKFFVTPKDESSREIAMQPGELLTEITIPHSGAKNATYEVRQKEALDWPLAAASVSLRIRSSVAVAEEAAKAALSGATPLSQNAYKVQLARVAVKRALLQASGVKA